LPCSTITDSIIPPSGTTLFQVVPLGRLKELAVRDAVGAVMVVICVWRRAPGGRGGWSGWVGG